MLPSLSTALLRAADSPDRRDGAASGRRFGGAVVGQGTAALDHRAGAATPGALLLIQLEGEARYAIDGRELTVKEGDGLLTERICGTVAQGSGARCGAIVLPSALLRRSPAAPWLPFSRLDGRGRLICDYARNVVTGAHENAFDGLDAAGEAAIIRTLCDLLNLILAATRDPTTGVAPNGAAAARLDAIEAFLCDNCQDPALSPSSVAAHFGISARYLDKLFRRRGRSFKATLMKHRLDACCAMLAQPDDAGALPIATIARRAGFATLTQFNRRFRAAYGTTPRAWRARQRWAGIAMQTGSVRG